MSKSLFRLLATASALSVALAFSALQAQAAGTTAAGPSDLAHSNVRAGSAASILPLTTTDVMPVGGFGGRAPAITGAAGSSSDGSIDSQAFGSSTLKWPYSTARVAVNGLGPSTSSLLVPVSSSPYRQAGKLFMRFGTSSWFVCSASLIKKGVLITAAHCVHHFGQGSQGFANQVVWVPANTTNTGFLPPTSGAGPYGVYSGVTWRIPTPYFNGSDTCQSGASGVVCNNDLATVTLAPKNLVYPGSLLGWYGYGWNGYSYVASPAFGNATVVDMSQLGYPVAFDGGFQMQRNNSFGKYIQGVGSNFQILKNTQLGSSLTGGSSGGPWLANFGTRPSISLSASLGSASSSNIVDGVTSWGYTTVGVNVQGASFFGQNFEYPLAAYGIYGAGNIGKLVNDTCVATPAAC